MKNQTARFTGGADSLVISLRKNREHIKTQVRHQAGEEKPKIGCKTYFDLTDDGEKQAQQSFEQMVKDAVKEGWAATEKRSKNAGFTAIPSAPGAKPEAPAARARR
jgi:hypothetical protein